MKASNTLRNDTMRVSYCGEQRGVATFRISSGPANMWFETDAAGNAVSVMPLIEPYASQALDMARRILAGDA